MLYYQMRYREYMVKSFDKNIQYFQEKYPSLFLFPMNPKDRDKLIAHYQIKQHRDSRSLYGVILETGAVHSSRADDLEYIHRARQTNHPITSGVVRVRESEK
jgi:hypothetical protein